MSLTGITVRSASWTALGQVGRQGLQVVTGVFLAHLLTPGDFGVFAMVAAFSGFASVLADLGLGAAVVHRADLRAAHLDAAFWATALVGLLLAGALALGGPALALFYDDPRVVGVARLIGVALLATTLSAVPRAVLTRSMRFRPQVTADLIGALVGAATAIAAAALGARFWAIPLQSVVASVVVTALLWRGSHWHPRAKLERRALADLAGFGGYQAGFASLNFWSRNADNLLIGRYVGPRQLGLYTRAYSLMLNPILQVAAVVGQVMFPAMSRVSDDLARLRRGYLAAIRLIALVTTPMLLGGAAAAPALIPAVLGERWADAVPLFQVLALAGALQAIGTSVGWIYQSRGRTDLLLRWGVVATAVTLVSFAVGIQWGAMGVAVAYAIRTLLLTGPSFADAGRLIDLRLGDVVREVGVVWIGSGLMGLAVLGVGAIGSGLGDVALAAIQVATGFLLFVAYCAVFARREVQDLGRVWRVLLERADAGSAARSD